MRRYEESIARFGNWLDAQLNPDGSLNAPNLSCNAYMPLPLYAAATRKPALLRGVLAQVEKQFVRNGELLQPPGRAHMMPYMPAWLLMGAVLGDHGGLRDALRRYLLTFQDAGTGGFFASVAARDARSGVLDFDSTTMACAALCVDGERNAATRTGKFLLQLVRAQPNPDREFFFLWDTQKGLITKSDPDAERTWMLRWAEPLQLHFKTALLVRAFTLLQSTTGDAEYLKLAENYYRKAVNHSPDLWTNTFAHKMGWAAHDLWRVTRNAQYAEDARRMADHLVTLQQADGAFHYPGLWPTYEQASLEQRINIGAQFATWIAGATSHAVRS